MSADLVQAVCAVVYLIGLPLGFGFAEALCEDPLSLSALAVALSWPLIAIYLVYTGVLVWLPKRK